MSNINILPSELYQNIFSFLPFNEVIKTQRTSRQWAEEVEKEERNIMMRCMKDFFHKWFREEQERRFQDAGIKRLPLGRVLQDLSTKKIGILVVEVAPQPDQKAILRLKYRDLSFFPEHISLGVVDTRRRVEKFPPLKENDFEILYRMYLDGSDIAKQWQFSALKIMAVGVQIFYEIVNWISLTPIIALVGILSVGILPIAFSAEILSYTAIHEVIARIEEAAIYAFHWIAKTFITAPLHYVKQMLLYSINSQAIRIIQSKHKMWKIEAVEIDCPNKQQHLATIEALSSSIRALA